MSRFRKLLREVGTALAGPPSRRELDLLREVEVWRAFQRLVYRTPPHLGHVTIDARTENTVVVVFSSLTAVRAYELPIDRDRLVADGR